MKIKITESIWTPFRKKLFERKDVESAGLLLARPASTDGQTLIVEDAVVVPDHAYLIRRPDQLRIDPVALNRLIRPARDRSLSVLTVHTHGPSFPGFSWADDRGDERLMPSLRAQIAERHHGSVVLTPDGRAAARTFGETGTATPASLTIVGKILEFPCPHEGEDDPRFERQVLALGTAGQNALRRLRVGIVGLGGIGSLVAFQLVHLGVGQLLLVDGDLVEASNLSRILGATVHDIDRTPKVAVAARYATSTGMPVDVKTRQVFLRNDNDLASLRDCDLVVSCVDRHLPRMLLNQFAYHCLVPLIDTGTAFRANSDGTLAGGAGRVVVVGPARSCLACWGHLDPHALRVESMSESERQDLIADGYIQGLAVPQPSVVPFNTQVAGAAVAEILRLVTNLGAGFDPVDRLAFDFLDPSMRRNRLALGAACGICGSRVRGTIGNDNASTAGNEVGQDIGLENQPPC